jgi:hypothetical protein
MLESNMSSNTATSGVAAAVAASQAAVGALVETMLAGQLRYESHDDLSGLVAAVRRLQARLESVTLAAVREVDTRRSHHDDGALSAAAWLRMHTRMDPTQATGTVRTARALDPDAAALARLDRRGLTLVATGDGTTVIRGQADEVNAAILHTAIDANSPAGPGRDPHRRPTPPGRPGRHRPPLPHQPLHPLNRGRTRPP